MIRIDGSYGEGGGQVLRSAIGLSLVTGKPFKIDNIRSGRRKSGLLRQHLTAVKAGVAISGAQVKGAELGSKQLTFIPGEVKCGDYHFAIGTAGSGTLVLQTILPALSIAQGESVVMIEGGTHNPYAPPYDFLKQVFLPILGKMGCKVAVEIECYGFYPAGGGKFTALITPAKFLKPLELIECGNAKKQQVRGVIAKISSKIAQNEVDVILQALSWSADCGRVEKVISPGPGNCVMIEIASSLVTELFFGFGEFRVPLEKVAKNALNQAQRYIAAGVPVGRFLADQLLIPLSMAGGGRFRTLAPSMHTKTNIEVIKNFLDVDIVCEKLRDDVWDVIIN